MEIDTFARSDIRPARSTHGTVYSATVIIAIFLTGFATISYQVIAERLIKLFVGGTAASSFAILLTTLVGMGLGAGLAIFPSGKKLFPYSTIAWISSVYTLISAGLALPILQSVSRFIISQHMNASLSQSILLATAILLTIPIAILSGAILPRIMRYTNRGIFRTPDFLYGTYTAGSAAGIYTLIRVLLPLIDFRLIFLLIAVIFLYIFCIFLFIDRKQTTNKPPVLETAMPVNTKYFAAMGVASMLSIILETSIFRAITVTWSNSSPYTYPFALLTYLMSYAAGSYILSPLYKRMTPHIGLAPLFLMLPIAFIGTMYFPKTMPDQGLLSLFFIGGFQHTGLIAFLSGSFFPLIISTSPTEDMERQSGILSFISSAGSLVGGLLFMILGLPVMGTRWSIITIFAVYLTSTVFLLSQEKTRLTYAVYAALLMILLINIPGTIWNRWIQKSSTPASQRVEGIGGVAAINWTDGHHNAGSVSINGTVASYIPYLQAHSLLAAIASGAPDRKHILILGLGGGGIVRDVLAMTNVQAVDIVEWSNELITLLSKQEASDVLSHPLTDPRVTIYATDAHTYTSFAEASRLSYTLIIDNLTVLGWSGSTSVRSIEYFRSMLPLLTDNGVYIIMLHHNYQRQYDAAISGLSRICPFLGAYNKTYVICSKQNVAWDTAYMDGILRQYSTIPSLQRAFNPQHEWIYQKYVSIQQTDYTNIEPIHDMMPYFEYEEFSIRKHTNVVY